LTAALVTGPAHGDLNLSADGSFTYLPEADYHGADSFTYTANDGTHDSAPATVALTINSVNDAPVAVDDAYFVAEDGTLSIPAPGVLSNDTDVDGDSLTASLDVDAAHGSLLLNADGSFTYTPEADYNGPDGFTYTVSDGDLSDTGAVAITVNPVNDAPVVDAGEDQQAVEGELVQFSGSYTDLGLLVHQPLAPDLTYTWDFGDGATASGTLTPEHAYADEGLYTVTLLVTDDLGAIGSDTLQVTVENAAPVIVLPPDGAELASAMHAELVLEISFTDPGWEDAHTLQVEWGDNTETRLDLPAGELEASPTHTYDLRGVYTVLVTLADEDGGQTQHTYTVTVEPGFIQYLPVIHTP
jgi:VCBS repeat-containing protein